MTKRTKIIGLASLAIIIIATPILCQVIRASEVASLSTEAVALYEDQTLTMLSNETTIEEIESLETKSNNLNEKWLVESTEEILANSIKLISDAKTMCQARDEVTTLFDENGVVKIDASIESAQTLVSETAKIKPEYAQVLQVQIDEAIRQQDAIQAVESLFTDKELTTVRDDVTVEMYDAAYAEVSKVSNEELKVDLNESLKVVDKYIEENTVLPESVMLDVPVVSQLPELPTGCEITALTMVFNYNGVDVTKTEMADEMPKHESDPTKGFVGDPYGGGTEGYTIYPVALMPMTEKYLGSAVDLTGCSTETLKCYLSEGKPIVAWMDLHGFVVHAITLTGYDENGFYYNDPWTGEKDVFISYSDFEESWDALGNMALSY